MCVEDHNKATSFFYTYIFQGGGGHAFDEKRREREGWKTTTTATVKGYIPRPVTSTIHPPPLL